MRLNNTFEMIRVITDVVTGEKPKVLSGGDKLFLETLRANLSRNYLKDQYTIVENNPNNTFLISKLFENSSYPISGVSNFGGIEVNLDNKEFQDIQNLLPQTIFFMPNKERLGAAPEVVILGNSVLRAHFSLSDLPHYIMQEEDGNYTFKPLDKRSKAEISILSVYQSVLELYWILFSDTHEIDTLALRGVVGFVDNPFSAETQQDMFRPTSLVLDAMVIATFKLIYLRINNNNDYEKFARDASINKLTQLAFLHNLFTVDPDDPTNEQTRQWKRYSTIVPQLVEMFLNMLEIQGRYMVLQYYIDRINVIIDSYKEDSN